MSSRSVAIVLLITGCAANDPGGAGSEGKADIWGTDDRVERYQIESAPLQRAALSSAATISWNKLVYNATRDSWSVTPRKTLGETLNLCSSERFADQPVTSGCSATLVAEDLVVTVGHCVAHVPCDEFAIVFDYAYAKPPVDLFADVHEFSAANVYRCGAVLQTAYTVNADTLLGEDYAVIQLDRKVTGRLPASVSWAEPPAAGTPTFLIGHPTGLPQKFAPAAILGHTADLITYSADTMRGNSGGSVYDADGTLLAIHSGSTGNLYVAGPDGCNVAAVCGDNVECNYPPHGYALHALGARLPPELRDRFNVAQ